MSPVNERLVSGLSPNRAIALVSRLRDLTYGLAIDGPTQGALGGLAESSAICREFCLVGHQSYTMHSTPLFFVPIEGERANAYAYCVAKSNFDMISMTRAFIELVDEFTFFVGRYLEAVLVDRADLTLAFLFRLSGSKRDKVDLVARLIRGGVFAFVVGHELGHLKGGHLPVIAKYGSNKNSFAPCTDDPWPGWDEVAASAQAESGADTMASLILNAHEVDADIQGMDFLARHWCRVLDSAGSKALERELHEHALATAERRYFLSLTCISIAFLALGFEPFTLQWKARPSHPLAATRLLIAMKAMPGLFPGAVGSALIGRQAVEAATLVHSAWGQSMLVARKDPSNPRVSSRLARDPDVAANLRGRPKERRAVYLLGINGIISAVRNADGLDEFLGDLARAFAGTETIRASARRTRAENMLAWGRGPLCSPE